MPWPTTDRDDASTSMTVARTGRGDVDAPPRRLVPRSCAPPHRVLARATSPRSSPAARDTSPCRQALVTARATLPCSSRRLTLLVRLSFFFFLPSVLVSGFMFPFRGMPEWAQILGDMFPLTHFLVIVRGILLKGNGLNDILPAIESLFIFLIIVLTLGVTRYRRTLD